MIEFLNSMQEYNSVVFSYSDYAYIAIGLGMVISLFLTETIGVMAGGIIVPGYFALYLQNPIQTTTTFFIGCLTYFIISATPKSIIRISPGRLL